MREYLDFVNSPEVKKETQVFREKQAEAVARTSQKSVVPSSSVCSR